MRVPRRKSKLHACVQSRQGQWTILVSLDRINSWDFSLPAALLHAPLNMVAKKILLHVEGAMATWDDVRQEHALYALLAGASQSSYLLMWREPKCNDNTFKTVIRGNKQLAGSLFTDFLYYLIITIWITDWQIWLDFTHMRMNVLNTMRVFNHCECQCKVFKSIILWVSM